MKNQPAISTATIYLDEPKLKLLKVLLEYALKSKYVLSDKRDEKICIIQVDSKESHEIFTRYKKERPQNAIIVISKDNTTHNYDDNITVVDHPVTPKKLANALLLAESNINSAPIKAEPPNTQLPEIKKDYEEITEDNKKEEVSNNIRLQAEALAVKEIHKFTSTRKDIDLDDPKALSKLVYYADDYLQGKLQILFFRAQANNECIHLNTIHGSITYLPEKHKVTIDVDKATLQNFASIPCNRESDISDIKRMGTTVEGENGSQSQECANSLLWKSAIWASRGRLPTSTNIDESFSLKYWPNFTRLMLIPHAMQIVALWIEGPITLRETVRTLNIPQRYVFSVYSAVLSISDVSILDLLVFHGEDAEESSKESSEMKLITIQKKIDDKTVKKTKHRGFIGKLLKYMSPDNVEEI